VISGVSPSVTYYAIDTNVAIDLLHGDAGTEKYLASLTANIALPVPVISELLFGDLKGQHRRVSAKVRDLIAVTSSLAADTGVARVYAEIRLDLEQRGLKIPMNDLWIAACCVAADVPLVSRDAHFLRVERLHLLTPAAAATGDQRGT
jgi:predicted nucleic acid-binding protein